MVLRAVKRDAKPLCDLLVGEALAKKRQNLPLTGSQDVRMARAASPAHSKSILAWVWPDLHYPRPARSRTSIRELRILHTKIEPDPQAPRYVITEPRRVLPVRDEPGLGVRPLTRIYSSLGAILSRQRCEISQANRPTHTGAKQARHYRN